MCRYHVNVVKKTRLGYEDILKVKLNPQLGNGAVIFQVSVAVFVLRGFKECTHFADSHGI